MKTPLRHLALFASALALSLPVAHSQTAFWTGGGLDTDWNNGLNWDIGVPAEGTNAVIGAGITVDYNAPMAATSFAGVNNAGILNINAAGFNMDAAGLAAYTTAALGYLRVNAGGVVVATNSAAIAFPTDSAVSVEGGTLIITNSTGNITFGVNANNAGAGFTNNGGTVIFSQPFQSRGRFSRFAQHGGTLELLGGGGIFESSNDQERQFLINGGTANLGNFSIARTLNTVGSAGLVISNGNVTTTSLIVGNGNAAGGATVFGGALTNTGTFLIADRPNAATSGQRRIFFYVRGGTVVSTVASGIVIANQANNSSTGGSSIWGGFLDINSGLLVAEKLTLVGPDALTNAHATLTLAGTGSIYLGSGGLVGNVGYSNTSYTMTFNGGTLGAKDDFTIFGNGTLGGTLTVKAADLANAPRNILHTGIWSGSGGLVKTGGGILTLASNCTYSGTTRIESGTLALGANGSISNSPSFNVGSGATLDVAAVTGGFVLNNNRTLLGFGSVTGNITAASGSTINPGSNTVAGTLTFSNSVTQSGGAFNHFDLSTDPSGPNNDLIVVTGDLNVSGINTLEVAGGGAPGSVHPLIRYGGDFNGTLANFTLSGASGTLSNNNTSAKGIYLIVASAIRSATNVTWVGNSTVNDWDTVNRTNWINSGTLELDYFVSGDAALFDATGAANPNVNIPGNVSPASVTVGAATDYTFAGNGNITGAGSLTKSNAGTLTISTTNGYTGATTIRGGVVEVTSLANGGQNSGIGAAANSAANLVFDGGMLRYLGGSTSTDRGATLNVGGGALDVATGGANLTLNGAFIGDGGLVKAGAGTLTMAVASSYTNGTVINGGTLQLNNAAGAGTGGITNNSATLRVNGQLVVDNVVDYNGNSTIELSGVGTGNVALRGAWSGSGDVLVNFVTQSANQTFTMGGSGGFGGGHMWDFSGTIDFGTNTGFARFNNNATSVNLGSSNATFSLGTGNLMLSQRNGNTTTHLGALMGGPNTWLSGRRGDAAGLCTYSIGANNLSTTFEGIITNGINEAAIIKVGTGSLRLTGNSPYSGSTVIESGTLQVDGSLTASPITVNAGALTGNGSLGGAIIVMPNGLLSPGTSIGRLTVSGSLTLFSGGTNLMEINKAAATNDSIVGLQFVSYGGTLVVSNLGGTLAEGDAFKLFDATPGAYFGAFDFMELGHDRTVGGWNHPRLQAASEHPVVRD